MVFGKSGKDALEIRGIPPEFVEILLGLPAIAENPGPEASARLFPSPAPGEEEIAEDWREHVEPGLRHLFLESRQITASDLAGIRKEKSGSTLRIPVSHADAWLGTLNQARLALAETHRFTEAELCKPASPPFDSPSAFARLKMDFFAAIQEWILDCLDGES